MMDDAHRDRRRIARGDEPVLDLATLELGGGLDAFMAGWRGLVRILHLVTDEFTYRIEYVFSGIVARFR